MNIWDQIEKDFTVERKEESQDVCGIHHWILGYPDGTREIRSYHCGICDTCKYRKGLEVKAILYSISFIEEIRYLRVPPKVADRFTKDLNTADYVRFPSADGFDYLFSRGGTGTELFSTEPDWKSIMDRRSGTRKTGKLLVFKKDKPEQTIPLKNIRAVSYDAALDVLQMAQENFDDEEYMKEIDNETELLVKNNIISAYILEKLDGRKALVFESAVQREYSLPINFKFAIKDNTGEKIWINSNQS